MGVNHTNGKAETGGWGHVKASIRETIRIHRAKKDGWKERRENR